MHVWCLPARSLPTLLYYACRLTAERLPTPKLPGVLRLIRTRALCLFANRYTVTNIVAGKETDGYTL